MRKITLFLASLFCAVGAMAQEVNYTPNHVDAKTTTGRMVGSISVNGDTHTMPSGSRNSYTDLTETKTFTVEAGSTVTLGMTQSAGSWMNAFVYVDMDNNGFTAGIDSDNFTPTGDLVSYSFYNSGYNNDENGRNSEGTSISGNGRSTLALPDWTVNLPAGEYRIRFKYDWCNIDPAGSTERYFNNTFTGHGAEIIDAKLVVVENIPEYDVVYNYSVNDELLTSVTYKVLEGREYPDPTAYGVTIESGEIPTGNVSANTTVDFDVTIDLPFEFAKTYEDIDRKWYYLSIGDNAYLLYHVDNATHIALDRTEVDAENKEAYMWAFVGNPFDGYKLVNKAKGEGYILSSSTNTFDGNTGGNTYPVLTEEPVSEGKNTYWIPTASGQRGGKGTFYLAQKDVNEGKNKMNNRGNKLAYWNGGADAGSTFAVELVLTDEEKVAKLKSDYYSEWKKLHVVGNGLGQYTCDAVALAAAEETLNNATTVDGANTAIADCKALFSLNLPQTGKFYRIKSMNANDAAKKGMYWQLNAESAMELGALNKLNSIVYYNEGKILLYGNGLYLNNYKTQAAVGTEPTTWTILENAAVAGTYALQYEVNGGNNGFLSDWSGLTNGLNDANAAWMFEEVAWLPIPVNEEAGYTTLYSPVELALSYGRFNAYTVSEINGDYAKLAPQTVVPAGVGVVLELQQNAEVENGCVFLQVKATETTGVESALLGTYADEYKTEDAYVLGYINVAEEGQPENKQVGFYTALKNQQDGTSWLNNGFKAYLPKTVQAQVLRFNFGGNTTAIESVVAPSFDANAPIYDLSGRRVVNAVKGGLYIQNGKKFIVK